MTRTFFLWCCLSIVLLANSFVVIAAKISSGPDSVYLFSFASNANTNKDGLQFAWSENKVDWNRIGERYGFLKSDYGRWGSEKGMIDPYLVRDADGMWHCIWSLNERESAFGYASSPDLVHWGRQHYPRIGTNGNFQKPVMITTGQAERFRIRFATDRQQFYTFTTTDFKSLKTQELIEKEYSDNRVSILLSSGQEYGQIHRVSWSLVEGLIKSWKLKQYNKKLYAENTSEDSMRFEGLKEINATLSIHADKTKPISDMLIGAFFEDINYSADGGLYGELIQNRDFEYSSSDKEWKDKNWNSTYAWNLKGENTHFVIDSVEAIHPNNPHYAVLDTHRPGAALQNSGFDGINISKGDTYELSFFAKQLKGASLLKVRLVRENGDVIAEDDIKVSSSHWKIYRLSLVARSNELNTHLEILPTTNGKVALDMISLFPQKTFKNRKNGLRSDLASAIADLRPRFVRFPGGCVAHGDGIHNIYRWKNTIGPLESRKPQRNLWGYHQTAGLGYLEYFQFCEDIGAQPVPVLAAGVPCQNSGTTIIGGGQQGGIPMDQMDEYVQEILDLIEFANGDAKTQWGRKRAELGHPKSFDLKFIGIGNEDLITDLFEERFTMIYTAVKAKYPEITVIGTVGPFHEGTDYVEGWHLSNRLNLPMVDEHYYEAPGWFIHNQHYYDSYDRSRAKVYLGEYAAHLPGRPSNLEVALAEALYLTALERNGDIVTMASYAPLLAKDGHTQWKPDLIYFDNSKIRLTPGYYVQKLFGQNSGNQYLSSNLILSTVDDNVKRRVAVSVVRDDKTGDVIIKMVNLLPKHVNVMVDTKDISTSDQQSLKTTLRGNPNDQLLVPEEIHFSADGEFPCRIPPYSLTIVRMKTK